MTVEWRPVVGWEGVYEVSSAGAVRNNGKEVRQTRNWQGYLLVRLTDGVRGRRVQERVHRLVARAFIPNPENKPEVNHLDGIKGNNALSNLEWATPKSNRQHAWDTGLRTRAHLPICRGERNGRAKLTAAQVATIRSRSRELRSVLAAEFGVSIATIKEIRMGRRWLPEPPR